jgi:hypothetical protein
MRWVCPDEARARFYDLIETDALLRPLFGRDLMGEREA